LFRLNVIEQQQIQEVFQQNSRIIHPRLLQFQSPCDHLCHSKLLSRFGNRQYDIVDEQYGLLTTSYSELESFLQDNEGLIANHHPFHSQMKISQELLGISATDCQNQQNEPVSVRFLLHPMSETSFLSFQRKIGTMLKKKFDEKAVLYHLSLPSQSSISSSNQEKPRLSGSIKIHDCQILEQVLQTLSSAIDFPEIYWIERDYPVILHSYWSKGLCDSGLPNVMPLNDINLTGQDEIIGISDTGIDLNHCYFNDETLPSSSYPYGNLTPNHRKIALYVSYNSADSDKEGDYSDNNEGHGTHVAGIVAGQVEASRDYGDYKKFSGTANNAKIAFADLLSGDSTSGSLSIPSNGLYQMFSQLGTSGAKIFTNSWGTLSNSYDAYAADVDRYMWDNDDTLILFSAGNLGEVGTNTVGSPSTNKNGLSVGASMNDYQSWLVTKSSNSLNPLVYNKDNVAAYSSRGPTSDRRLKPDLLAPGYYVYSAKGRSASVSSSSSSATHCDIQGMSGTSMAAPTMAGYAARIRQYYREGYYPSGQTKVSDGFVPSGALIKATLIHSGQPMSFISKENWEEKQLLSLKSHYPSVIQGYGRVQLSSVLNFQESSIEPLSLFVIGAATSKSSNHKLYREMTRTGEEHYYHFQAPTSFVEGSTAAGDPSIRLTFCYTDYPGSLVNSVTAMVNQLTVFINDSTGNIYTPYLPDGMIESNTQMIDISFKLPPSASSPSSSSSSSAVSYSVGIKAKSLLISPQPYAFVLTGQITPLQDLLKTDPAFASYSAAASSSFISSSAVASEELSNQFFPNHSYLILLFLIICWLITLFCHYRVLSVMKIQKKLRRRNYLNGKYTIFDCHTLTNSSSKKSQQQQQNGNDENGKAEWATLASVPTFSLLKQFLQEQQRQQQQKKKKEKQQPKEYEFDRCGMWKDPATSNDIGV
jgi:hypothetical protein